MNKYVILGLCAGVSALAFAEPSRDNFLKQQAYAEMQRVSEQVEVIEQNQSELSDRVFRVEGMKREIDDLKSNVAALQAQLADLRAQMAKQRAEIIAELSGVIKKSTVSAPPPQPPAPTPSYNGKTQIYTVQPGDTLSLISEAFGTKIKVVQELNNLKGANIRVGQKLRVPATR